MVFNNINFIDEFGKQQKLEFNNIYCVDCMKVLKLMPDKSIDLCIVDPPYGIGMDGGKKYKRGKDGVCKQIQYKPFGDNKPPEKQYFEELFRVSKNQIIWGANHFIEQFNKNSSCWVVWDKDNGEYTSADCELAWASFKSAVRKFKFKWQGMLQENMKIKEKRIHPTQKPVALYEWLLNNYAKKGDKILDTHLGSASSIIACKKLGFDYLGFELDSDYFKSASERIAKFESQENMFDIINTQPKIEQENIFTSKIGERNE